MVTVLDGHPHTLAFLATINHVPGDVAGRQSLRSSPDRSTQVYRYHGIDTDSIVRAALDLTS